ncbi:MAG TPA: RidA family protein [Planctomycetota bacterium]|nr:RidA family protein [Planctomycetota bacterium]
MSKVEERLRAAGLELPPPSKPIAIYVPAVITGSLLFVSGHGPLTADRKLIKGCVGEDIDVAGATEAAKVTALNMLATVKNTLGSLDRVKRLVKTFALVRGTPGFGDQPKVVNGFSVVMRTAFGEEFGVGARSAMGTSNLPEGICVEVECVFEITP